MIGLIFAGFYSFLDNSSYDFYVHYIKKPVKEDDTLLLVDIDDNTMNSDYIPFSWPFPRYIHGDAVEIFTDFGAKAVVYDIEFLNKSPAGVNVDNVENIKRNVAKKFSDINGAFKETTGAIINQSIKKSDLVNYWEAFEADINGTYSGIIKEFESSIEDNDEYFAKRLKYNGKVFGTVNMLMDNDIETGNYSKAGSLNEKKFLKKYGIPLKTILGKRENHPSIIKQNIAEFPYDVIADSYKNVGFTKVDRDKDAVLRSINLFMEKDGYVFPQISIAPFLYINGVKPEQIDLSSNSRVVLKNVVINGKNKDISIPIYENKMLINFPGKFDEIFISNREDAGDKSQKPYHLSYGKLLYYKYVVLKRFSQNLENLAQLPDNNLYGEYLDFINLKNALIDTTEMTGELRSEMDERFDIILASTADYVSQINLKRIEDEIDAIVTSGKDRSLTKEQWAGKKEEIRDIFEAVNGSVQAVKTMRAELKQNLKNKICFVGLTSTGTTDMGPTAFQKDFLNVGVHPSIYNTVLQQDFLYRIPAFIILIMSLIFFFGVMRLITGKGAVVIASAGVISVVMTTGVTLAIFRITNVFISPVIPFLYGLSSSIMMIALQYILTESEKRFIRNTFNRYLSPAVIQELIKDPGKIELGGEVRFCSAMFTDIESFSSFSEQFMEDPKTLVSLLNRYLSAMSDVILENGGTIDKYEGDAIIAFFGAPLEMENHAYNACRASLQMKKIESDLNKKLVDDGIISRSLKTRIGINTGNMFVGNMGTSNRLDYTMMGHSVNLAARLEGVNKQYGTYQLISEFTYEKIKGRIITRKLDRVRVVNINTPIRLYELVALPEDKTPEIESFLSLFDDALTKFEQKDFNEALRLFNSAKEKRRDDKTVDIYIDRCGKYIKTLPVEEWDGVYNLTMK